MSLLSDLYMEQEKRDEAQVLGEEVLQKRKTRLGEGHPDTLTSKKNLGVIYIELGRLADAEELLAQVMMAQRKDHPGNLNTMYYLAIAWNRLGREAAALDLMRECVQRCRQIRGADPQGLVSALEWVNFWEKEAVQNAVA
jgi:tetratricopeptide (TPR) repeat protein